MSFDPNSFWNLRRSSASKPTVDEARKTHGELRKERKRRESLRPFSSNDKPELKKTTGDTDRTGLQQMDARRELRTKSKVSEYNRHDMEQARGVAQHRDKPYQSYESVRPSHSNATGYASTQRHTPVPEGPHAYSSSHMSQTSKYAYYGAPSEFPSSCRRGADDPSSQLQGHRKRRHSDATRPSTTTSGITPLPHTAEPSKRYEALSKEYEFVRGELETKTQRLEEKDHKIKTLKADISTLQRRYDEQSTELASLRHELSSCQSQLDNVQRIVSTADMHADQDIIQKLQGLNEEVYKMSMLMADCVAECISRPGMMARRTKERKTFGDSILASIGHEIATQLATVEGPDDAGLFLQIAFQAYLSNLLCYIVSSWTTDQGFNALVEGMYQRLRKAETQAISGRWRSLTRTHILPTPAGDPKILVEHAMAGLTKIVVAAGFFSSQLDATSRLSKFSEKISSIVSHAGKFADMLSEMISGDFEIFAIQPGTMFNRESMTTDEMAPRATRSSQTVLCVSRVGLRKQVEGKTITLIKAQVVPRSFLG